jgi:UDP-N-acetylglucosamine 2-epimerase (non-hydrolysing)
VHRDHVVVTGNTVVDSLLHATTVDRTPLAGALSRLVEGDRTVVVTAHRRESWGEPMAEVARALLTLVERHRDIRVILVKHPNPVVGEAMARHVERSDRIVCVDPLPYQQFVKLLAASCLVLTDSGGLQEELPSLGIPLVVLRAETERSEGLTAGTAILAGTTHDRIVELASAALCAPRNDAVPANPFGDGAAGERALDAIGWMLGVGPRPADFSAQVGRQARVVIGAPTPPTRLEPPSVPVPQRVVLAGLEE